MSSRHTLRSILNSPVGKKKAPAHESAAAYGFEAAYDEVAHACTPALEETIIITAATPIIYERHSLKTLSDSHDVWNEIPPQKAAAHGETLIVAATDLIKVPLPCKRQQPMTTKVKNATVNPIASNDVRVYGLTPVIATATTTATTTVVPVEEDGVAVLLGKYIVKGGIASWKGRWGFNKRDFLNCHTSKFNYTSRTTSSVASSGEPISGLYDGCFYFKVPGEQDSPARIAEKKLHLTFTKSRFYTYTVHGVGSNQYGTFEVSGTLNGNTLQLTKVYTS